jgi:hypothetical protein
MMLPASLFVAIFWWDIRERRSFETSGIANGWLLDENVKFSAAAASPIRPDC